MKKADAILHFKTAAKLSAALIRAGFSVSSQAVSQWPEQVPELQARRIDEVTRGQVKFDKKLYTSI